MLEIKPSKLFGRVPWILIVVFVCLIVGMTLAGNYYYSVLVQHNKNEKYKDLVAIADLKVGAIAQWRSERLNDGVMIQNDAITRQLQSYLNQGKYKDEIVRWIKSFTTHNGYSSATFLDNKGNIRLSVGTRADTIGINERALVQEVFQHKEIVLSDLRMSVLLHAATFDLFVPVTQSEKNGGNLVGVLILRIDPYQFFYPLLQSWPIPSLTSEIALVRRDGNDILLLNELRYKKDAAFKFRLPVTKADLPASMAVRGMEGTVEGIDYRGVPVFAALEKVPDTPWYLIAKIDQEEVNASLHQESWLLWMFVLGMIITAGSIIGLWWRHQRALFYRKQYEAEVERKALVSHFDNVVKYANDIIILSDVNGKIVEVNDQACRKYGYNREEILQIAISDLRPVHLRGDIAKRLAQLDSEHGLVFETQHQRKDGTLFPVEISARQIIIDGRKYVQGIIRDISERKQAEELLVKLRKAVDASGDAIFMTDRDGIFTFINSEFTRMYGYGPDEVIGKTTPRILKGGKRTPEEYKTFWQTILSKKPAEWEIINRTKDGRFLSIEASVNPVLDEQGTIIAFLAIQRDITERKRDEEKIKNLNRVYAMLSNINQAIVRTRGTQQLFDKICQIAVEDGKFLLVWVGMLDETAQRVNVAAHYGRSDGYLEQLHIAVDDSPIGRGPSASAIREGKHFICNDIEHDERMVPWRDNALKRGFRSVASFPFMVFGKPMGNINFYSQSVAFFDEREILLLDELAADVAFALESIQLEKDRKRSELAIVEAHKFTKTILANSPVGILTYKATGECVTANETAAQMVGATIEQLQTQNFRTLESWKKSGLFDAAERALAEGRIQQIDFHLVSTFGKEGWFAGRLAPFMSEKEPHLLLILTDISERKQIEEQLRSSEQYYRQLINTSPDGIAIIDKEGTLTFASPKMYEIFNLPAEMNVVGKSIMQWIAPEDQAKILKNIRNIINTKTTIGTTEYKLMRHNSTEFWGELRMSAVLDAKGNITGIIVVCHDITERKQAEELVHASELKYRNIFRWSPVGIYQTTVEGNIHTANESLARILEYDNADELLGLSMQRDIYFNSREGAIHFEDHQHNKESHTVTSEYQWKKKDGSPVWISLTCHTVNDDGGNAIYHEGLVHDVTHRKRLEEELRQAQKLESVGTLASGIAHDFNNILGIILGHASLLDRVSKDSPHIHSSVESITKATQRGAALVRQLLTFARKTETFVESVRINDIIQELAKLIAETFPKSIRVVTELTSGLPSTRGDASQLHQVILNLSVNARDAMPNGGTLTFSTSLVSKKTVREKFPTAALEEYARIIVSDTGMGMDENTRRRIFEPFFTTKGLGKGTGLGMAVVYGIVESHRGFISIESELGKGTTFTIYLPVETGIEKEHAQSVSEEESPGGTETILVVEDEEMLRIILQETLEQKGYHVLTAADGEEAVEIFSQHQRDIAAVVSDVGLPKMTGDKVFFVIKKIAPSVRVILASGFLEPDLKAGLLKAGVHGFVQKPYRQHEILTKIRSVLDQKM
jgi:PAS domain S-box-containing protein